MSNDRFKFRVWVDEAKRYCANFSIDTDGVVWNGHGTFRDGIVIEQCTGIRDRNGRLIYEGDIVTGIVGLNEERFRGTVFWSEEQVSWMISRDFYITAFDDIEIVGNIHEAGK